MTRTGFWILAVVCLCGVPLWCGCAESGSSASETAAQNDGSEAANKSGGSANGQTSSTAKPVATGTSAKTTTAPRDITFDDIKFDMEKGDPFDRSMLTEEIEALDGSDVKIRGYILPSFQQSGLTQFILVRDNQECCFGPGAALFDCIVVEMLPGRSTDFSVRPVAVQGTFTIRELTDGDGKHLAIYRLDGKAVQ